MARRREDPPSGGNAPWMNTFADLMNLLLCFFVMLFAMSDTDTERYNQMAASMNSTFSIFDGGDTALEEGVLIGNGISQLNNLDQYINSTGRAAEGQNDAQEFEENAQSTAQELAQALEGEMLQQNEELSENIEEAVYESSLSDQVEVSFSSQYVQLTMKGALLFDSGSAELKGEALDILDNVGVILERYSEGTIEIEGHTDNVPISSAKYADNEELSSARALSVFYYLVENTSLDPARLRHAGMGDREPIADNSTEEGRSRNRRVEIRIYNPAS
ncbi:flagellar motor protein MotB [Candidatus Acetatifactor stercoripullorum]|uniref:flagellar motor protein MotB n=1 Tax=Candidatus Acetatifactor stercoripullorum TaxID=2838414 RepID=UPI00298E4F3D|nr:flagellar motor protein MotB [Candidatus Acetatifactor stercoripullorum]